MRWFWWQMLIVSRLLESFYLPPPSRAERANQSDMLTDLVAFIVQLYADEVSLTFLGSSSSNLLVLAVFSFLDLRSLKLTHSRSFPQIGGLRREHDSDSTGFTYGFSRVAFVANLINGTSSFAPSPLASRLTSSSNQVSFS